MGFTSEPESRHDIWQRLPCRQWRRQSGVGGLAFLTSPQNNEGTFCQRNAAKSPSPPPARKKSSPFPSLASRLTEAGCTSVYRHQVGWIDVVYRDTNQSPGISGHEPFSRSACSSCSDPTDHPRRPGVYVITTRCPAVLAAQAVVLCSFNDTHKWPLTSPLSRTQKNYCMRWGSG